MSVSFRKRTITDKIFFDIKGKTARFKPAPQSAIGEMKCVYHRPLPENYNMDILTILNEAGQWYSVFTCTSDEPRQPNNIPLKESIGIDLGLYSLMALSDETLIDNPR